VSGREGWDSPVRRRRREGDRDGEGGSGSEGGRGHRMGKHSSISSV